MRQALIVILALALPSPVLGQEAAEAVAVAEPVTETVQVADSERPPTYAVPSRPYPAPAPISVAQDAASSLARAELASPIPDPLAGRRYPVRGVSRPLTLSEGQARLDQGIGFRGGRGLYVFAPQQFTVGITNDFEMALVWPISRDPSLQATGRVFSSPELDVGVRGTLTVPAITTGNTVARIGVPIVIRAANFVRIVTGIELDLLFTAQVSPMIAIPVQLQIQGSNRLFYGLQGSVALINGNTWTSEVGTFLAHTNSAYAGGPIMETRIAVNWLIEERTPMLITTFSFFPRLW